MALILSPVPQMNQIVAKLPAASAQPNKTPVIILGRDHGIRI